jgi:hypothetical protein
MSVTKKDFKIHSIDNGFCRVNYMAKNAAGQTVFYCLQDEGKEWGGVICYRCTSDDFEPDYEICYSKDRFEIPAGDTAIEIAVRKYLCDQ